SESGDDPDHGSERRLVFVDELLTERVVEIYSNRHVLNQRLRLLRRVPSHVEPFGGAIVHHLNRNPPRAAVTMQLDVERASREGGTRRRRWLGRYGPLLERSAELPLNDRRRPLLERLGRRVDG